MEHDFDPYDMLLQTQYLVEDLAEQHNKLVEDYAQVKRRIKMLEDQVIELQLRQLKDEI